jgi:ribonuclease H2 subunit A
MVYGAALAPLADKDALAGGRFADSKVLTEAAREAAHSALLADARLAWRVSALSGRAISAAMLGRGGGTSLNALAWDSTCALLDGALADGAAVVECCVDTVGDADAWAGRLRARYPGIAFTVCPKADALFPIVSAASIVAKVTRDREVAALAKAAAEAGGGGGEGGQAAPPALGPPHLPMGSGYPGDPLTKAWLEGAAQPIFGFPACVRFSWATVEAALAPPKGAAVSWEDDEGAPGAGQARLTGFGGGGGNAKPGGERDGGGPSVGTGRPPYFRARRLQRVALA